MREILARILKSKTLWINGLALAVQLLTYFAGIVPPEVQPWLTMALAVVNLVLRFVTSTPIVPGPDVVPTPEVLPQWVLWLRDIMDAKSRKEIPAPEADALAVKVLTQELAGAGKESEGAA